MQKEIIDLLNSDLEFIPQFSFQDLAHYDPNQVEVDEAYEHQVHED